MQQGSLHYTPEHCLVNGGLVLKKHHVSNGCKMEVFSGALCNHMGMLRYDC